MMGKQPGNQQKLFYYNISLEQRVSENHLLRKIKKAIDFDFVYQEVNDSYGYNGNVSVPPPVILKMLLLLVLYNVRSERELLETLPVRLDWLWFLGFELDSEVPNHSVLSKARVRWGVETFKGFFERIVGQCVVAGLVDGKKLFIDSSLIDANASNNSVVDTHRLGHYLKKGYREVEQRLEELTEEKNGEANKRYLSTTDPDASVTRHSGSRPKLRYKTHRGVDGKEEVITATQVTAGSVDDGEMMEAVIAAHEQNTGEDVAVVVGDSRYGIKDNYLLCAEREIKAHLPNLEETQRGSGRQEGIIPKEAFMYDAEQDAFLCPAGELLRKRNFNKDRQYYEYKASRKVCAGCELRAGCTRAKDGRSLKRHVRQDELDRMLEIASSAAAQRDIKTRQHLSERSFARSTRYGYKRARWRGLWRMQIQDFLIAAVQNIQILIKKTPGRVVSKAQTAAEVTKTVWSGAATALLFSFGFSIIPGQATTDAWCFVSASQR
jgi:transposase